VPHLGSKRVRVRFNLALSPPISLRPKSKWSTHAVGSVTSPRPRVRAKNSILCALRELCGDPLRSKFTPHSNHHSNATCASATFSAAYGGFECYFLTTSSQYGTVQPVIALAQKNNFIVGRQVAPRFSQNGTPVTTTRPSGHEMDSHNCPRITSLRLTHAQPPSNHILTQKPWGDGAQPLQTLFCRLDNSVERSSILALPIHFTNREIRNTEHGSRNTNHAPTEPAS
jgi:hypothetical protein